VSGERNLLSASDLASNMDRMRRLFEMFEQKTSLLHLLELSHDAHGAMFIGGESGIASLDECSVIMAPYEVDGCHRHAGRDGPTRWRTARDSDRGHHGQTAVERADAAVLSAEQATTARRTPRASSVSTPRSQSGIPRHACASPGGDPTRCSPR
jgi:hypothetical protein